MALTHKGKSELTGCELVEEHLNLGPLLKVSNQQDQYLKLASQGYYRPYSPSPPDVSKKNMDDSAGGRDDTEERYSKDWRNFQCKTWHLEPTVRLLSSWGGKSIEPYGVDYILQKLGFSHARTTIPKWMQRGFMDPLDKVLALLVLRIIALARDEPKSRNT